MPKSRNKKKHKKYSTQTRSIRRHGIRRNGIRRNGIRRNGIRNGGTRNTAKYESAKQLNLICSNSGYCLAFGRETDKINALFDNFTDFNYVVDSSPVRLLNKGANGFVNEITFRRAFKPERSASLSWIPRTHFGIIPSERSIYSARTIMKSHIDVGDDNLFYEYIVGKYFVNEQSKYFPCFLETYGLFRNKLPLLYHLMKDPEGCLEITKEDLINNMIYIKNVIRENASLSCVSQQSVCLLSQYIEKPMRVAELLETEEYRNGTRYNVSYEMLHILYQIYAPLVSIQTEFTHYDLHAGNVILSVLEPNTYIQMVYNYPDGSSVRIKTHLIVKILDYGRSYFKLQNTNNPMKILDSMEFYNKVVCATPECQEIAMPYPSTGAVGAAAMGSSVSTSSGGGRGIIDSSPSIDSMYDAALPRLTPPIVPSVAPTPVIPPTVIPPTVIPPTVIPPAPSVTSSSCGELYGYNYLNPNYDRRSHIKSSLNNVSHDLRFANIIGKKYKGKPTILGPVFNRIVYEGNYGTPERKDSGESIGKILNISDMLNNIYPFIRSASFVAANDEHYRGWTSVGTLNIYLDRSKQMEFTV